MRFEEDRTSSNVEDHRGRGMVAVGGGGLGLLLLALVAMYFGIDPRFVLQVAGPPGADVHHARHPAGIRHPLGNVPTAPSKIA